MADVRGPRPPQGGQGGEHVTFSLHGQGFEVEAEHRWRTVSRLVLLPEPTDDVNARISVTTEDSTVYVDRVSFALAEVERGDADKGMFGGPTAASASTSACSSTTSPGMDRAPP